MFRIKDLMIKVAPEGVGVACCTPSSNWPGWTGPGCDVCTLTGCDPCTMYSNCTPGPTGCGGSRLSGFVVRGGLAELKAALKQQLEAVETQERLNQEGPEPRTLEEAEMLEAKLVEALEEVRAMKGRLGKGK